MQAGVEAAFLSALLYNLAIVVQKTQAERADASGVRIIGALWRRPLWLLGIALQLIGFALHAFALTRASVTVVQPIIASGLGFVVFFSGLFLGERPHAREIAGMAMSTAGVCLLIARYDPLAAMERVAVQDLGLAAGTAAALIAVLLSAGGSSALRSDSLRAALVGTAAGIGDGMSDSMNRLAGAWLDPQAGWIPPTSMGVAAIALLLAFGFQGFVSAQNALKLHRANTVAPFILTAQMLVPIAMGATIYGQSLPHGGLSLASWLAGLALTLGGLGTKDWSERDLRARDLARSRRRTER
jgi:drug/metabolite transporter (DMT)-like permease